MSTRTLSEFADPEPLTLTEQVEACDDCDGTHFMCPEHRHASREQEDEQAAMWRREDDLDAQAADREHRAEDDSLWVWGEPPPPRTTWLRRRP